VVFLPRLKSFPGVAGRMERIEEGQPFNVLVDYAHTDDALRNALGMLRSITPGRLLVVFGCGGKRDRTKRPLMVKAVQEFADQAFATADNPRSEALAQIFADMRAGVTAPEKITWIDDRRRAISLALDVAKPGDCLLIAGKGHESYQEFADTVIPFDDPPGRAGADRHQDAETDMSRFAPDQLARWTGGRWTALPARLLAGFATDTRQLQPGQVFVALKTDRRDGHDFLLAAEKAGASAAIVSRRNAALALSQLVVARSAGGAPTDRPRTPPPVSRGR